LKIILFVWNYVIEVGSIVVYEVDDIMVAESNGVKKQKIFFVCSWLERVEHGHKLVKSNWIGPETLFEKNVLAQPHGEVV
jgi:hypothetical protein